MQNLAMNPDLVAELRRQASHWNVLSATPFELLTELIIQSCRLVQVTKAQDKYLLWAADIDVTDEGAEKDPKRPRKE